MGSKRKVKKILTSSTPPNPNNAGDVDVDLVEDLFAELDSREKTVQQQQEQPASPSAFAQTAAAALDKMSSKSRFMARQVRVSHRDRSELVTEKAYPKARKVTALAEQQPPTDATSDAKLEREAKEEERTINKICNELGLDMHEVSVPSPHHSLINENADQPGRPLSVLRHRGPAGAPQPPPTARGALRPYAPRRRRIHARASGGLCAFPAARRGRGRRGRL
jgi:OTU domain-containing protein 6